MTRHLVKYEGRDIFFKNIDDAIHEVSFDDGNTWRVLSEQERNDGVEVSLGQPFVARISKRGLWPVVQKLAVTASDPGAPQLDNVGPKDIGNHSFFNMKIGYNLYHIFCARLTLFRDASQDRKDLSVDPIPQYSHDILAFDGVDVLSNKQGSTGGLQRFAAHIDVDVPSYGQNGNLIFAKTPNETNVPRLIVVFVPNGLNLMEPVPVHIFFTPHTGEKKGEYPYTKDWNAMVDNYLVGGKRMINQHVASHKRCVFVFPVAPPDKYFTGIQEAARLRQYLFEMVYFLQRTKTRFPNPKLLHCAVSGFSGSGPVLLTIMRTSLGDEFPELHECYGLDLADVNVNSFSNIVSRWWNGGEGGKYVRIYSHDFRWLSFGHSFLTNPAIFVDDAQEYQGKEATFVLTPIVFWQTVCREEIRKDKNKNKTHDEALHGYFKNIPNHVSLHQAMPSIFMEHALKNSGFPDM